MAVPTLALLHGFLGFSRRGPIEYFRGVEHALREMHIIPLMPEVSPAGTIAERAEALARQLFLSDAPTFALVAHSMGGLDARHLITYLDPHRRIKSLLTVATPHRGSPLALWFLQSHGPIPALIRHIGNPGLGELTPEARAAMPIPDRDDVDYSSYASCRPPHELPFWFRPYGRVIPEDNDGMVPVSSTRWGKFRGVMRTDHLEFIGWSLAMPNARVARPFNHIHFWKQASAEAIAAAEGKIT
ncbi:MAG: thioesterase [Pseudomonadota bacterium]|nr:thioesterase [Pseudomonadota bacterium]